MTSLCKVIRHLIILSGANTPASSTPILTNVIEKYASEKATQISCGVSHNIQLNIIAS